MTQTKDQEIKKLQQHLSERDDRIAELEAELAGQRNTNAELASQLQNATSRANARINIIDVLGSRM